jgi:hypothetical protein
MKPALSVDSDELSVAFCANVADETSDRNVAIIVATDDNDSMGDTETSLTGSARLSYIASHFDDTSMQPRDGIER